MYNWLVETLLLISSRKLTTHLIGGSSYRTVYMVLQVCTSLVFVLDFKIVSLFILLYNDNQRNLFRNKICDCESSNLFNFSFLTLIMPNFLNGIIHLPFLDSPLSFLGMSRWKLLSWSANSIEPGQAAWMCRLAWL